MSTVSPDEDPTLTELPPSTEKGPCRQAVRFVTGTPSAATTQSNHLLAERLRNVSLVLGLGFLAFLVLGWIQAVEMPTVWHVAQQWCHVAVTAILLMIAWRLCTGCVHALAHLRLVELLIFGPVSLLFLVGSVAAQLELAGLSSVGNPVPPWLLIIFMYALYIPNTWRRAAWVLGVMTTLGLVSIWLPVLLYPEVNALVRSQSLFEFILLRSSFALVFSGLAATWGVRTIGTLRRQVQEAQQIGQYRLKKLLGQGGMGEVHLAEHVMLRRPCAVKLIAADKAGDPRALARFEREVQSTAKLSHWNTVEIFDYGRTDDGVFYYVMEYLPGLNLQQVVERGGPLPPERVIHFLSQACDALREAHDRGLIHRDIKPANIFAAIRGGVHDVVKLLDFGLVRDSRPKESDVAVTQQGMITGSPLYMSPEQATGEPIDARTDIYSLGIVGYYLLTGNVPFQSDNWMKVMMAHAHQPLPPMSNFGVDVPDDLNEVIERCLRKSPEERYATAAELLQALEDCEHAGRWTRQQSDSWWNCNGCPQKRALDEQVLELAGA